MTSTLSNTPNPSIRSRRSAARRRVPANSPSLFSSIRWSAAVISVSALYSSPRARYYFALEKSDLRFTPRVEHGLRKMDTDAPEFVEALAQRGNHLPVEGDALKKAKGAFVLLLQALQSRNLLGALP